MSRRWFRMQKNIKGERKEGSEKKEAEYGLQQLSNENSSIRKSLSSKKARALRQSPRLFKSFD
jgi:hypothetical protein